MTKFSNTNPAFGHPGIEPHWSPGNKDGVGTANAISTRLWFTLGQGVLNEVYYPTVDSPQIRELQYVISDGTSFADQEKLHLDSQIERLAPHTLGYRITNSDPEGRYQIVKEVITDPKFPCLLQHTKLTGDRDLLSQLRLYVLCSPHLAIGGWDDNAAVIEVAGWKILTAEQNGTWLAIAATVPFTRLSCGYIGESDGWTDLCDNFQMDWEFDCARSGNVALMGEIDPNGCEEFTLGMAFGDRCHDAVTTLLLSLDIPFEDHRSEYIQQWTEICQKRLPLEKVAEDNGSLYCSSYTLLLAHEDKIYPGAMIASLSIPWGEAKSDKEQDPYHLVWPRDMVNSVTALLAAGETSTGLEALVYLAASQCEDGGFAQNFWIDGTTNWKGIQLDQVSFPISLAWRMYRQKALRNFDPYPTIVKAAQYLIDKGPSTQQERWEENSGYSPSTLAANIAALVCAGFLAREHDDESTAQFLEDYADFLEQNLEAWTVTTQGTLLPEIPRHYIRINPVELCDRHPNENPNEKYVKIANRPPGTQCEFPAKEIIDAGFLELVRYGIRSPHDPLIVDSLKVVDAVLKVETPYGDCWHRYNHDGYGQREDGGPFLNWGKGRAWPLLTGERGHYELAAGGDVRPYIQTLEALASETGLLPEQVWDEGDRPELDLYLGRPTGSAMPLAWAHAEYIKLLRSVSDGQVFDLIPEVADRYLRGGKPNRRLEIWKFNRQITTIKAGCTLRILAMAPFQLRWSDDDWQTVKETDSTCTAVNIDFVDIAIAPEQQAPICFTFFWKDCDRWEESNYQIEVIEG